MRLQGAKFGCNTYAYTQSMSADACVPHLAELGFRSFELMMYPGHLWPADTAPKARASLRQRIEGLGAEIVTLNMPNVDMNIAGASPQMRRYTLDLLGDIIRLAGELGAPGVVIGPGKANPLFSLPREVLTGHFFAALDELAPIAEKAGTALWVENMPFAFLPLIDDLMAALDRYGNPAIGIVWDAANSHFVREDLGNSLRRCRARLKLVHLSDTGQDVYRHDAVGTGTVPFAEVPPVLAELGHGLAPMLEIITPNADRDILASAERLAGMGYA
jgi:L-ribulose-5-phosphate 3-epimerase